MHLRLSLAGVAAIFVLGLTGCGKDDARADAAGAVATANPAAQSAPPSRGAVKNHIELVIDGSNYRADTASNFGHTFLGDEASRPFHLELSSGWIGSNDMSIVKVAIQHIDNRSRTFELGGTGPHSPSLELAELPGRKGKHWRAVSGSLDVQFQAIDPRSQPVDDVMGTFDARVREVQPHGGEFIEGGETLAVTARFDFKRGRR